MYAMRACFSNIFLMIIFSISNVMFDIFCIMAKQYILIHIAHIPFQRLNFHLIKQYRSKKCFSETVVHVAIHTRKYEQ